MIIHRTLLHNRINSVLRYPLLTHTYIEVKFSHTANTN